MRCPFCFNDETVVKDSRQVENTSSVKRRRMCQQCQARFTTVETFQVRKITVVKKDGQQEPFDREKLERAISTATRKRNITDSQIEQIVNMIKYDLEQAGDSAATSKQIGEMVMQRLITLDPVSYIRFASVYKDFQSICDFRNFLKDIE